MEYFHERRHLVSFNTSQMSQVFCNVLVIGSGIAGLRAGLAAAEHVDVLIIAKREIDENNTAHAQGGIAAALGADDTPARHSRDTLAAGHGLCDAGVVDVITGEAPERIRELIEWGADFDKEDGKIALAYEGGHTMARIAHAQGDATGRELQDILLNCARRHPRIRLMDNSYVLDLITRDKDGCFGAFMHGLRHGPLVVWAKQTILAAGGCGLIYRETTNPAVATGDGLAMAYRAGAEVMDLEFYQFHPTVLYVAGASRALISEAVRGEGAFLLNVRHERFMPKYHERAELAPRDTVSRAIVKEIRDTGHTCAYLDMRHIPAERLATRFPRIRDFCAQYDINIAAELVPIRPAAHYMVGGVRTDVNGHTNVPRLFACGEVACSGLHGANRLGSNSLIEGLVIGARAGEAAGRAAQGEPGELSHSDIRTQMKEPKHGAVDVDDVTNALRAVTWRNLGIERSEFGMSEAATMMRFWSRYVMDKEFNDICGWELQNMLFVARLLAESALAREESRGVHYRTDFTEKDDAHWRMHILLQRGKPLRALAFDGTPIKAFIGASAAAELNS